MRINQQSILRYASEVLTKMWLDFAQPSDISDGAVVT